ncbi:amino acid permease [Corynebacterium pacaense]|uniref:amino acid permease n=1 Tax=Corynebacterium pacaense TaxID=1816684 RepID=UPI0011786E22|nr:amino acid permease [Corynebacterium pacaense]
MIDKSDAGYAKAMQPRHLQMIAIGGSIGTGLFLGAGGRLAAGGPALAIVYAVCGFFAFMMVRALGELSIYRPSSGAFVSYAREFMGEKGAYATGWLFFLDWATTVMADITAVALYLHFWSVFVPVPQWLLALVALVLVFTLNMLSVKAFGEFEFWFAMIKVAAILIFMVVAIGFIVTGHAIDGHPAGFGNLVQDGSVYDGIFPHGLAPMITLALGVVFAFGGTEMVGVAAGETRDAARIMPKAINSMIWRIALFYVGSVILFTLVMPWTAYSAQESPFVTFFSAIGVPHAGDIMQVVVLTAALSSLNAGLYATGRTLRSMAVAGSGPRFAKRLNRHQVPSGGIIITASLGLIGVLINYVYPTQAFDIVMNLAGIGIAGTWMSIMISHWLFVRKAARGEVERPAYRLPFAPWTNLATIVFLTAIIVFMWFADEIGRPTILLGTGIGIIMVAGWFLVRKRIDATLLDDAFLSGEEELINAEDAAAEKWDR